MLEVVKDPCDRDKYPFVAIILLTWNGIADTLECLDSIGSLDYPHYQTVLVDNASSDGTVEKVRAQFPRTSIIENTCNLGYAEGNNVGIRYAQAQGAKYILILNNDVIADPAALTELLTAAEQHQDAAVLAPKICFYSQPNVIWSAGAKWNPTKADFDHIGSGLEDRGEDVAVPAEVDYAAGCAMLLRAEAISRVGLLDSRFFLTWEETDWCYRARRHGYRVLVEPKARIWHKVSRSFAGGSQGPVYEYYFTRNRLLWIEKNLTGGERSSAFRRCMRELYWWMVALRRSGVSPVERAVLHARLQGGRHYFLRRFGPRAA